MLPVVAVAGGSAPTPAAPTASVGAAPSVLTSFALVSLDFTGSTDPAGGGLTYSATMDVKPTGSATTLVDSTTSTPDFTPDKIGTYSGVLTVTDINGRTDTSRWFREVRSALSVSIAAVADQLDLAAVALDSTVTGGVTPYTYAWTVNGATTGLSDATAADPTFTPTKAGAHIATCTVTDAAGQTNTVTEAFRIGTSTGWVRKWLFDPSALADHNFVASALTVDGVQVRNGSEGAVTSFAIAAGVLTLDTAAATGGLWLYPIEAMAAPREYEVCWISGVGAEITSNNDGHFLAYNKFGGAAASVMVEVRRDGGLQKVLRARAGGVSGTQNTSGGAQGRVTGLHLSPGFYAFRPLYGTSAWTATLSPDDLLLGGGTTSGWHSTTDVTPAETADEFTPNAAAGSSPDELVVKYRPHNSTTYTIPGISYWVRMRPI